MLHSSQQQHIRDVMSVAAGEPQGLRSDAADPPDALILDSWARCMRDYKLDPTRAHEAIILPSERVREHRDRMDAFLSIARHGLETLYGQVAGAGYCVLLTDARGVTVDFLGDIRLDASLRRAGLYLGSDWNERHVGTCGVGTAITTGNALTVHQHDHFDAAHIPLTCTAVPLYDPLGRMLAVLDISALTSPRAKSSQRWALEFLRLNALRVENANFLRWFRRDWIVKVHPSPEFVEISPDYLIALDPRGRVIGHNRAAQQLLETAAGTTALGLPFERFFGLRVDDLARYQRSTAGEGSRVSFGDGQRLYLQAVPPPVVARVPVQPRADRALPAPLRALSAGDPGMEAQLQRAARIADTALSVLLSGETGSGKEYLAKALHASSGRADGPFVAVNCAAIPDTLIESELFGHLPGSFSGATSRGRRGLILEAHGGTLFLDEIGDMPRQLQPRLLRVLAEREVLPLGASRPTPVDLRVIAATHADLQTMLDSGGFRADLYYRLAGAQLRLPPLRARTDLRWLAERMLAQHSPAPVLSPQALQLLAGWHWPGNLRELRNALDYAAALCRDGVIEAEDLPEYLLAQAKLPAPRTAGTADPRQQLLDALQAAGGNLSRAAQNLGVSRMTVYRRLRRAGIAPRSATDEADPA